MLLRERPSVERRRLTARRITICAQELTLAHGIDGFTMDDLALSAEVSRRTLFNYFAGKDEAVLGRADPLDVAVLERFAAGGPTGNLIEDLATIVLVSLRDNPESAQTVARRRDVIAANPRLIGLALKNFEEFVNDAIGYVERREGPGFDRSRIDVAIALVVGCFHLAMDRHLNGSGDLAELFTATLTTARELLA